MEDIRLKHETIIANLRTAIGSLEKEVLEYKKLVANELTTTEAVDVGEAIANITLSYRHLEDARMRLGKVLQVYNGGKSIYDK